MRKAFLFILSICSLGLVFGQNPDLEQFSAMKARSIGPAGMSGRVTSIDVVHAQSDIIYVGTASGGVWKSESGGIAWKPIFDDQSTSSIGAVAVCQSNPSIVWAGTGEGNPRNSQSSGAGVFKSLDAGKTWTLMGLEESHNIHRVIIHPDNPDVVYVGAQGPAWGDNTTRGVYKTTDGGETWKQVLKGDKSTGIADLVIDPTNPNKLIAAMWDFRRTAWDFRSGGPGSAIFITMDGGKNWKESREGLPKGDLGRIGIAIAPSQPNRVYAIVEAKKNGFYRSNDGGATWAKVNRQGNYGNRPFYYADIYVDSKNENRVYSIHSLVTRSEDGGNSWKTIIPYTGAGVHPDHHALWIHPDNPNYLINGNDGGMAISRDRAKSWQFVENLPLAQFYHINIDNDWPYHVYGGMQDNGSWQGPAYVWKRGGIRNSYWQEVAFGDGFDVVPDPENSRFGYAMWQGGNLNRYDVETGRRVYIQPAHPEGLPLRFNWNAAIAQDPFNPAVIYYGSQFVHRSPNRGNSWSIISPDLTTNDPEKQKQKESGGLTLDVTDAENHTTILCISPSPIEEGVIWAGTDDGNVHITRDRGTSWNSLNANIPGLPANGWVAQITPSKSEKGAAWLVVNNYRNNDWKPYLWRTSDYGATWTRKVKSSDVTGHCLSVVEDSRVKNLVFLGTEAGLYVSFDGGDSWTKWTHGLPTAPVQDLKIHPREHDLILGTFGRAAYVLDDIRPLRELAANKNILDKALHAFNPPVAVHAEYIQAAGTRFAADAHFKGQNRRNGATMRYWIKEGNPKKGKKDTLKVNIVDMGGKHVRRLAFLPDSGLNTMRWDMRSKGVRGPQEAKPKKARITERRGSKVLNGTYKVVYSWKDSKDSTFVNIVTDPRLPEAMVNLFAERIRNESFIEMMGELTDAADRIRLAQGIVKKAQAAYPEDVDSTLKDQTSMVSDTLNTMLYQLLQDRDVKGIQDFSDRLISQVFRLMSYTEADGPNSPQFDQVKSQLEPKIDAWLRTVNDFFDGPWKEYRKAAEEVMVSPFEKM
ncbi:MAG: WD40/YVTN/BNR-like repeat-containing protein [Bacteroidia bacterium]